MWEGNLINPATPQTQVIDATTGKITVRVPYTDLKERFGHPYYLYHRVDLHNGLRELTLETRQGHPQTQLRLSSEVVDIDCENGILTLKDGSQITKDLLVVADGVHVSRDMTQGLVMPHMPVEASTLTPIPWPVTICQPHQWKVRRRRSYRNVLVPLADTKEQTPREPRVKGIRKQVLRRYQNCICLDPYTFSIVSMQEVISNSVPS